MIAYNERRRLRKSRCAEDLKETLFVPQGRLNRRAELLKATLHRCALSPISFNSKDTSLVARYMH